MKKTILFAFAALAVVVGCSKKNIEVQTPPSEEEAWVNDVNLPVPVRFGSAGLSTKAIQYGYIDGNVMQNLDIGIIGLDTGVKLTGEDWYPILDGLENFKVTTDDNGAIVFQDKYYPIVSNNNYSFYGYYPHSENLEKYSVVTNSLYPGYYVTYQMGNTDILWADAVAEDYAGLKGYNAAYVRKVSQDGVDKLPNLDFEHLTTALRFYAVAMEKQSGETLENVKVTKIEILDVQTSAKLCVWASNERDLGKFSKIASDCPSGNISLTFPEGQEDGIIPTGLSDVDNLGAYCGTALLVPGAGSINVDIHISVADTPASVIHATIKPQEGGTFDKNYYYPISINIKNPQEVTITTSLREWNMGSIDGTVDGSDDVTIG